MPDKPKSATVPGANMTVTQRAGLGAQPEPGQPVNPEVDPTKAENPEPAQAPPGNTQQPPPMNPELGAASPPSPVGGPADPGPEVQPEQNPLTNSNVLRSTVPPFASTKQKPE